MMFPCWHFAIFAELFEARSSHVRSRISFPHLSDPMKVSCSCGLLRLAEMSSVHARRQRCHGHSSKKLEMDCLGRPILCLQSGTWITQWMVDLNEIEECIAPWSMLALNDATFVGARG